MNSLLLRKVCNENGTGTIRNIKENWGRVMISMAFDHQTLLLDPGNINMEIKGMDQMIWWMIHPSWGLIMHG